MPSAHQEITRADPPDDFAEDREGQDEAEAFSVIATSRRDALQKVRDQLGIGIGTIYSDPSGSVPSEHLVCTRQSARTIVTAPVGGEGLYLIANLYSSREEEIAGSLDPNGPAEYRYMAMLQSGPVDLDWEGMPILNSADEPFDPPISGDTPHLVLNVKWVTAAFSLQTLLKYQGAMNSTTWTIRDPSANGEAKVQPRQARIRELRRVAQQNLFRMTAVIDLKPYLTIDGQTFSGFDSVYRDRGTREKINGGYVPIFGVNKDGTESRYQITKPVPLDGAGRQVEPDANGESIGALMSTQHHGTADFNSTELGI